MVCFFCYQLGHVKADFLPRADGVVFDATPLAWQLPDGGMGQLESQEPGFELAVFFSPVDATFVSVIRISFVLLLQ